MCVHECTNSVCVYVARLGLCLCMCMCMCCRDLFFNSAPLLSCCSLRPLSLCRFPTTIDGYTHIGYTLPLPHSLCRSPTTTVKTSPLRFGTPDVRTSASSFTLARATQSKGLLHYIHRTCTYIRVLVLLDYTYIYMHTGRVLLEHCIYRTTV